MLHSVAVFLIVSGAYLVVGSALVWSIATLTGKRDDVL